MAVTMVASYIHWKYASSDLKTASQHVTGLSLQGALTRTPIWYWCSNTWVIMWYSNRAALVLCFLFITDNAHGVGSLSHLLMPFASLLVSPSSTNYPHSFWRPLQVPLFHRMVTPICLTQVHAFFPFIHFHYSISQQQVACASYLEMPCCTACCQSLLRLTNHFAKAMEAVVPQRQDAYDCSVHLPESAIHKRPKCKSYKDGILHGSSWSYTDGILHGSSSPTNSIHTPLVWFCHRVFVLEGGDLYNCITASMTHVVFQNNDLITGS